jgi:hypothetical protein
VGDADVLCNLLRAALRTAADPDFWVFPLDSPSARIVS